MKIERVKNSKRNLAFGLVNKCIMLLFPFFIRTLMLSVLSSEHVGLSSLFTSVLSVLNLAELGFGSALVFSMYAPLAKDDTATIRALINLYKKLYRIIGLIVLAAGLAVLPFIRFFISGSVPSDVNVYILFAIYLLDAAVTYFVFPYSSCVISSLQRTDIESNIFSAVYTLMYALQIAFLIIFKNYYAYIILQPIFNTLMCVIRVIVVKKLYPDFYPEGDVDESIKKDVKSRVKALFGHKLGTVVLYSADSIVVSAFLGLTDVAIFWNYYYIHASVLGLLQVIYNAIKAGVGNSIVTENEEKTFKDFKKLTFANSCIVGWCTVCLLCLYNRFMFFWMGGDATLLYGNETVIALCVYFYLNAMRWMVLTYKDAAGMWREDAVKPYVESIVNLVLNIILIQTPLKVLGVVISSIAAVLIAGPWETRVLLKKHFHGRMREYYFRYVLYTAITLIITVVTYLICRAIAPGYGLADFAIRVAVLVTVPVILYVLAYFKTEEFKGLAESLKIRIFKK